MDSIKQQTLNALSALGYNNIREIEAACINMEATNGKDKILVVPIIEEFTQSESYFRYILKQANDNSYNTINFVARTTKPMELFDTLDLYELCSDLTVEWIILKY